MLVKRTKSFPENRKSIAKYVLQIKKREIPFENIEKQNREESVNIYL